jgi:hypothetical protein
LKLLLLEPKFDFSLCGEKIQGARSVWQDKYVWDNDTVLGCLAATPTLRRLHLTAGTSHPDKDPQFEEQGLNGPYIKRIAKSCPYLTHLELNVCDGIVSVLCSCPLKGNAEFKSAVPDFMLRF